MSSVREDPRSISEAFRQPGGAQGETDRPGQAQPRRVQAQILRSSHAKRLRCGSRPLEAMAGRDALELLSMPSTVADEGLRETVTLLNPSERSISKACDVSLVGFGNPRLEHTLGSVPI